MTDNPLQSPQAVVKAFFDGEIAFYGSTKHGALDGIPFEHVAHVCHVMAKRLDERLASAGLAGEAVAQVLEDAAKSAFVKAQSVYRADHDHFPLKWTWETTTERIREGWRAIAYAALEAAITPPLGTQPEPRRQRDLSAFVTPSAEDDTHAFRNFHRLLCERFGYTHDEVDWRRDQASLIEWIARQVAVPPSIPAGGVREALEHADEWDWRFIFALLKKEKRGPDDARVGFWQQALRKLRASLSLPAGGVAVSDAAKPGTLAYARAVDADMTDLAPKEGETEEQARARRDYYRGFDDDGLPSD